MQLPYRPPFDWDRLLAFFAARATPGVEQVEDGRYLRSVSIGGASGIIDIRDANGYLALSLHGLSTDVLFSIVQRVRHLFDLDASTDDIARVLSADKVLRPLVKSNPGVRVPGAWGGFELTVRAILGQQVSVSAATTLAGRIANRYGDAIDVSVRNLERVPNRLFPRPEQLVRARLESLGIIGSRAQTIRSVAKAVLNGELDFDSAAPADSTCAALTAIKGIGDWTAEYVSMRALKDPDAFPASDLGLLRAFDRPETERMKSGELKDRAEAWRPWRAYAALLIWGSPKGAGGLCPVCLGRWLSALLAARPARRRGAGLAGYFKRLQRGRTGCWERPEGKPAKRCRGVATLSKG